MYYQSYPCKHAINCHYRACTGPMLAHNAMFTGTFVLQKKVAGGN